MYVYKFIFVFNIFYAYVCMYLRIASPYKNRIYERGRGCSWHRDSS